jgi:hypothetical protein
MDLDVSETAKWLGPKFEQAQGEKHHIFKEPHLVSSW